jgi:hypothetical protein
VLALAAFACDSGATTEADAGLDTDGATLNALAADLTSALKLSTDQQSTVNDAFTRLQEDRDPGALWGLAAELQVTLSDDQKATLLERAADRTNEGRPDRGALPWGGPGARGDGFPVPDLTDAQRATLQPYREQMRALMDQRRDGTLSEADFRAKMEPLRETMDATLSEVLTDEQRARFETMKARRDERRAEGREKRDGRQATRGADREARAARRLEAEAARQEALALSADQQTALQALRDEQRTALQALRGRGRDEAGDRDALREEARALRDAHEVALADILDARQLETMRIHQALVARAARTGRARDGRHRPNRDDS